jgi:hypothetical protein
MIELRPEAICARLAGKVVLDHHGQTCNAYIEQRYTV